jgi:hypothetical protein
MEARIMSQVNVLRNQARRISLRIHHRLGANGLGGIALAVAGIVGLVYAHQAQLDSRDLEARIAVARQQAAAQAQQPVVEDLGPRERLHQFQSWLPAPTTVTEDLRKIYQAATKNNVVLSKGEYSLSNIDGSGGIQQYDIVLPVKESYPSVKGFVAEVLNSLPHASLSEMRVERSATLANELDTRVHFTLYYRIPA